MEPSTVATIFGTLLIAGVIGLIALVATPSMRPRISRAAVPLAAVVAVGATAGSLYFSESAGFIPCDLCWYQRIAMYPMSLLLVIATIRRDRDIMRYTAALSIAGMVVSAYHVQLQLFPDQSTFCELNNPCTATWVDAFGWMTIPQMAGTSFVLIAALSIVSLFVAPTESPDSRYST